ncbi:MAG: peptidoglycan-binding protein LysM [Flavobacteriaceae bacterium]|nr:peptidoglycan-binding protein LysM [Flavobacteriaceae bacterium]
MATSLLITSSGFASATVLDEEAFNKEHGAYKGPYADNTFYDFKEALGFKESGGRYHIVNRLGYLGKYQFGKSTLKSLKIFDTFKFLKSPKLQEKAFVALCSANKWALRREIKKWTGKTIKGVVVTESGILAAAHLSGATRLREFFKGRGARDFRDAFGTSITDYMRKFSGFDTTSVESNLNPVL